MVYPYKIKRSVEITHTSIHSGFIVSVKSFNVLQKAARSGGHSFLLKESFCAMIIKKNLNHDQK